MWTDLNRENRSSRMMFLDLYAAKNEALEMLHPVEQGFDEHCPSFKW